MSNMRERAPDRGRGARNSNQASRYAFPGTNPYTRQGGAPLLKFGDYGELTPKTINQAGLVGEERKRAQEMMKVQQAYLEIYQALDFPSDPDGHVVDLSGVHMTQPKVAIAWTLALLGFRSSGKKYIKQRPFSAPGVYENAYTYVDVRSPDDARDELLPTHRAADHHLPPDTRRLAAIRDDAPGQQLPEGWAVRPKITEEFVPREQCGYPEPEPPAATMDTP